MLTSDLKHVVQSSVKKAMKENTKVFYEDAVYEHVGESKSLDLIVKPFRHDNLDNETNFAITFIEKELDLSKVTEGRESYRRQSDESIY